MARCSICHTLVRPEDEVTECPECRQAYHASCWSELGGCATYACARAAQPEKASPAVTGGGWGDTKTCPACGRTLHPDDLDCRCGATFPSADPMSRQEHRAWMAMRRRVRTARLSVLGLFLASLLGFPAPVTGPLAGFVAHRAREDLAGSDGTYLAIGYAAAALGAVYALVLLLAIVGP
jgi:hypothetical protein